MVDVMIFNYVIHLELLIFFCYLRLSIFVTPKYYLTDYPPYHITNLNQFVEGNDNINIKHIRAAAAGNQGKHMDI